MNQSSFNAEDVKTYFKKAKMPAPKNINDTINKNIRKGYIMEDDDKLKGKKAWMLTGSGEKLVQKGFVKQS